MLARGAGTLDEALAAATVGLRRVRIGDYRVVFCVEAGRVTVLVGTVVHRHDVCR